MSSDHQSPSDPVAEVQALRGLLADGIVLAESRQPGDPADLLSVEAHYVKRAVGKRIREFAAGRACARRALAVFGVHGVAIEAAADRSPQWPPGFVGSITHTAGFCAAAVAARTVIAAIGLDTEIVGAPTPDIWPTIAVATEAAWIESLPAAQRLRAITVLFSAKEAFYKCQYPLTHEWLDFHDLQVTLADWGGAQGTFTVAAQRSLRIAERYPLPIHGRYRFHDHFVSAGVSLPALA